MLQHDQTLENFMLTERSQTQNVTYCMISLYEISRIGKSIETENRLEVARCFGGGGGGGEMMWSDCQWVWVFFME